MEKGRKGRQKREEERGVENKMRGKKKRREKKIWNEKDSQGREEKRKGVRKIKFKSWDRIP